MGNEESTPRFQNVPIHVTSSYVPPGEQQNAPDPQRRQTQTQTQAQPQPGWVVPHTGEKNKVYPNLPPNVEQSKHAQATMPQNPTAPPMLYPQPAVVPNPYVPQAPPRSYVTSSSPAAHVNATSMNSNIWLKGISIPNNAFRAGHDTDGTVIYICRGVHEGDLLPGKRVPSHNCAYVPYCGKEIAINDFEILIGDQYKWIKSGNGHVPAGAIEGGRTDRGEKLFIGRASHERSLTPGKIHPSHGCLYIPYGGEEFCFKQYEVLVHSNY